MTLTRYLAHLPRWGVEVAVALEDGTQSPSRRRKQRLYAVTECADHFCFWHETDMPRCPVCTENLIRVDDVMESHKLAE